MADYVFNIAKGAVAEKVRDGANFQALVINAGSMTDITGKRYDTVSALLGDVNAAEVTNGNYARKSITNGSITLTVDDTNDRVDVDVPNQTWTAVAAGTAWTDLVFCEDVGGADTSRVPLTNHDFVVSPDGSDITAQVNASGIFRAS